MEPQVRPVGAAPVEEEAVTEAMEKEQAVRIRNRGM